MKQSRLAFAIAGIVAVAALAWFSLYAISPTEQVIVLQFGAPLAIETAPGLHAKIPLVQTVAYIDKRLLDVEVPSQEVMSLDRKWLTADAIARWRIVDPIRFNARFPSKEIARQQLATILGSDTGRVFGEQTLPAILSEKREQVMEAVRAAMNQDAHEFGVVIVDARLRRVDLLNSDAVYRRMQQEMHRQAEQLNAEGLEIAQTIRARAETEATIITAQADSQASILRGEGDAEKTRILAEAYGEDPDFFAFYRSMKAYQDAFPASNTTVVLSPDSEFFRYFMSPGGVAAKGKKR